MHRKIKKMNILEAKKNQRSMSQEEKQGQALNDSDTEDRRKQPAASAVRY